MSTSASTNKFFKLSLGLTLVLGSVVAQQATAHGYVDSPKSRSLACYEGINSNCRAPYEPQGVEFGGGGGAFGVLPPGNEAFPVGGPKDGDIAAGGLTSKYGNLNTQTADRWTKTKVSTGKNTFRWHYTAAHQTAYWQFFITKKGWNPNMPLSRSSFESTPIGQEIHNGTNADSKLGGMKSTHTLNIPADRSGYNVILATWKTSDTSAAFYQVIDVDVQNGVIAVPSKWSKIGSIQPSQTDLKADSVVTARVMVGGAEDVSKQTVLTIQSDEDGKSSQWPHKLATKINAEDFGYKAGLLNKNDEVKPAYGLNNAYVQKDSKVSGLIIDIQRASPAFSMDITGLNSTYKIQDGKVTLHFNVNAIGDSSHVQNIVYNAQREEVARGEADVNDGTEHFSIDVNKAVAGNYDLVTVAKAKSGKVIQKTSSFKMMGEDISIPDDPIDVVPPVNDKYDFTYPNGIDSYTFGTRVLQPKDGSIYQCKPLPHGFWCKQGAYAPGGIYSSEAWTKVSN
ncbi:lytic polysaccharide monooxygenase [Glaciimonas immobilis]|uniref:Chitin-binding protein n=1 Tax=Glaciimonas immobilis TaxID=728004 RepID=A0A840RVN1_9BURK|nr:lytic polysaccharide monooxygenase [Glaciimonas immobilis]KAF3998308.1 N-acetylglucosamine-binding protein GbpA [Glaciimonas immobilis]MBB5201925.1 chitin-binding protein [Glaciimonas immobilis]